ncbi:hypothetical protein BASA62_000071 [Batrachochytrium salamandrivorans]|nr:hypothetical protein BASA62_000071 [Batrachochytrium salamandrivorans]
MPKSSGTATSFIAKRPTSVGGLGQTENRIGTRASRTDSNTSRINKSVQNEYIRNLQQQIYLLELETRYLTANHGINGKQSFNGVPRENRTGTNGLDPAFPDSRESKTEPSELKRMQSEMNKLKDGHRQLELELETTKKERDELLENIIKAKDHHGIEKDKIYGEMISMRKKYEAALSESQILELSYKRIQEENETLDAIASDAKADANATRDKVDEQIKINGGLSSRVDELIQRNTTIMAKLRKSEELELSFKIEEHHAQIKESNDRVKQLEVLLKQREHQIMQLDHLKLKMEEELKELLSKNAKVAGQKTEAKCNEKCDLQRSELERIRGAYEMLKITLDVKDQKIDEIQKQVKNLETARKKIQEEKSHLVERVAKMESRLHTNEIELIQVGQDKSLLTDDVAELKIQLDDTTQRLSSTNSKNNTLVMELEKYKRDLKTLQEFASVLDQVESNGQNYLQLMRNMRKYLDVKE